MPEPATPVFIVTSSRPRVGKTLIARALTEYFCAQRRPVAAFDVNPDEFKLIDYLPAYTAAASLNDTRGEMALFDQLVLEDQVPKVVDLGHQPFDRFFAVMQQIDFAAEARRRAIAPMVLFVADPDERARQGYAMLATAFRTWRWCRCSTKTCRRLPRSLEFPADARGGEPIGVPALTPWCARWSTGGISRSSPTCSIQTITRASSTNGWAACSSRSASLKCGSCSAASRRC